MPSINIYLNFNGNAADAIQFYHSVLGGELFLQRMSETPYGASLPDHEKNRLMHGAITLDNGHLMVSDILESAGHQLRVGNNTYVSLAVDSRAEADRIMTALSNGGSVEMPMDEMFWGDYFGMCTDRFGIQWMINTTEKEKE